MSRIILPSLVHTFKLLLYYLQYVSIDLKRKGIKNKNKGYPNIFFWSNLTHLYLTWFFGSSKQVVQRTGHRHCCPSFDLGLWGGSCTGNLNFQWLNIIDIKTAWLRVNHDPVQTCNFDLVKTSDLELVKTGDLDRVFNSNPDLFAGHSRGLFGRGGKLEDAMILQGALWAVIITAVIWKSCRKIQCNQSTGNTSKYGKLVMKSTDTYITFSRQEYNRHISVCSA